MKHTNYNTFANDLKAQAAELSLAVTLEDELWQEELIEGLVTLQRVNDRFTTRYICAAEPYLGVLERYTSFGWPPPDGHGDIGNQL